MREAFINVQCKESVSGNVGTFLTRQAGKEDRKAISPVFKDLAELFPWMRRNGWALAENVNGVFVPWRVEAALCPACGQPYNPNHIPPPRVPLNIRCACCCQ
jgi:hypothetical protein